MKTIKISFIAVLMACLSANAQFVTSGTATSNSVYTNGNVGIGTASPNARLDINSTELLQNGSYSTRLQLSNSGNMVLFNSENTGSNIRLGSAFGYPGLYSDQNLNIVIDKPSSFIRFNNIHNELMRITSDGSVGIGTACIPLDQSNVPYKLAVAGKIITTGVRVKTKTGTTPNCGWGWPDFVFDQGYKLKSLNEVENFIAANKHLPGIPAAKEVDAEGFDLEEMVRLQMMKIEELTLYMINLKKENEILMDNVNSMISATKR